MVRMVGAHLQVVPLGISAGHEMVQATPRVEVYVQVVPLGLLLRVGKDASAERLSY